MTVEREKRGAWNLLFRTVCATGSVSTVRTVLNIFSENYIIIVSAPPRTVEGKNFLCGCIRSRGEN
jgi:hypothetical protein